MKDIAKEHGLKIYYDENLDINEAERTTWWAFYKYDFVINEYITLREKGENPAINIDPFYSVLSYGTAYSAEEKKNEFERADKNSLEMLGANNQEKG